MQSAWAVILCMCILEDLRGVYSNHVDYNETHRFSIEQQQQQQNKEGLYFYLASVPACFI